MATPVGLVEARMCGIIAVIRRPAAVPAAGAAEVVGLVAGIDQLLEAQLQTGRPSAVPTSAGQRAAADLEAAGLATLLGQVADRLALADAALSGVAGLKLMLLDSSVVPAIDRHLDAAAAVLARIEAYLDSSAVGSFGSAAAEHVNHELTRLRDGLWAIQHDRLGAAASVADLIGAQSCTEPDAGRRSSPDHPARVPADGLIAGYLSVHQALAALDRLEVRGRDSAGLHLLIRDHALDLEAPSIAAEIIGRGGDVGFGSGSVRVHNGSIGFVYKAAAEIGELGDNTAALRKAIASDWLLAAALASDRAQTQVLGHTRWASVGIISEPNAHPLNSETPGRADPYVIGAVNGDIDNFSDLLAAEGLSLPPGITTDSKALPSLMALRLAEGHAPVEALRRSAAAFEGSVAIASSTAAAPDRLLLALRGSGQALYVGLAGDAYIVASEPYGIVAESTRYIRMEGDTPANPDNPHASRGQVIELDCARAGSLEGIRRLAYDGTELVVSPGDVLNSSITTRDIDRRGYPHYFLKEISEAPASFRRTLRGKIVDSAAGPRVRLGGEIMPPALRSALRDGSISKVFVIGQGTAAVAGESLAAALVASLASDGAASDFSVLALPATELSGFRLRPDMSDSLVVAISQSGTTTDTNRTVDLVRARGARVVAIVNRRDSDLTERADGVLYTSDGRDIEMSVASTKAFYSQIAAGLLLALAIASERAAADPDPGRGPDGPDFGRGCGDDRSALLNAIRGIPEALAAVLDQREVIAAAAHQLAPQRRHWAVVGNGSNSIAAREVRIKLSELCYMSIACDVTEDKKHIDLSSEPLIVVCAAGLSGSTADDVAKEVAIFRAHKAAPLVVADQGERRFDAALAVLPVPVVDPRLSFILAAMAGHLFGYEAALTIDASAQPLREARSAVEQVAANVAGSAAITGEEAMIRVSTVLEHMEASFSDGLRQGSYDGHMEASTAVRISAVLRYALGRVPLDSYQIEFGKVGTPAVVLDDLVAALTLGIEQLTRPVDAIKHQAKTVTVGISRTDQTLLEAPLAQAVIAAGAPRDQLSYAALRTLAELDPAVDAVVGYTRYRVEGLADPTATARAVVVDRGGISLQITSRTGRVPDLVGTKHQVAVEHRVLVARGRSDGRTVVLVPEVKSGTTVGITLLHVRFSERLSAAAARGVLQGYRNRYSALLDMVTETEPTFRDDILADLPALDLLTAPISELAEHWRVGP